MTLGSLIFNDPWNLNLLVRAGFALADRAQSSGLVDIVSQAIYFLENVPCLDIVPTVCLISNISTEFITSNYATATLIILLLHGGASNDQELVVVGLKVVVPLVEPCRDKAAECTYLGLSKACPL